MAKTIIYLLVFSVSNLLLAEEQQNERISKAQVIDNVAHKEIELVSFTCPRQIYFGDTCYVQTIEKNISDKQIHLLDDGPYGITKLGFFNAGFLYALEAEGIAGNYEFAPEWKPMRDAGMVASLTTLQPGGALIFTHPLEFPPLQVMEHPYWKEIQRKTAVSDVKCKLTLRIPIYFGDTILKSKNNQIVYMVCTHDLLIKARPAREMRLLDQWLANSPKELLPPVLTRKLDSQWWYDTAFDDYINKAYGESGGHFIEVKGIKYNPWVFIREDHRKPPAWLCPENTAGWKELEESMTPSTMRDEIRLTRILIQYCETQDESVLKELREWFDTMNEVQRTVMMKTFFSQVAQSYRKNILFPRFREIYLSVRKYDTVVTPHFDKNFLQDLVLIDK